MSTYVCPVIKINMEPHPNADSLSIMEILGYEICLRTEEWKNGQLAVYVPPDFVVPDNELFSWLKTDSKNWNRIRTKRFRGKYSHGILVPAPSGLKENDNAIDILGIVRYEPPLPSLAGGNDEIGPLGFYPKYDIENFQTFRNVFNVEEKVIATEKIHGANARYVYTEERMFAGSRTRWKAPNKNNLWWRALSQNLWIEEWCKNHPGLVVYGEIFGQVQELKYGSKKDQYFFRAFDILNKDVWLNFDDAISLAGKILLWVPKVYEGPFDENKLMNIAIKDSYFIGANHKTEGIVIRPIKERIDSNLGRVILKIVSPRYLEKAKN